MANLRKMIASLSVVAILSSFVVSTAFAGFSDVPADAYYADAVQALVDAGVVDGTAATFSPAAKLQRQEAAKFAVMSADLTATLPAQPSFKDVPATSSYYSVIETAVANGVLGGYSHKPGYFGPADTITREQFAKILVEAFDLPEYTPAAPTFPDVNASMWSYKYVETAYHWSVINGYATGKFGPTDEIVRQDGAVMTAQASDPSERAVAGDDDDDDDDDDGFSLGGNTEGSIDEVTIASADESEALEGQKEVEVYAFDVKLDDNGPLQLQRVDIHFGEASGGTASTKPWDYFEEISLTVDGEIVATIDTSTSSGWSSKSDGMLSDGDTANEYRLRFTGLEETLPSDESTKIAMLVSVEDTLDSDDESAVWQVEATEMRVMDETGFVSAYNEGMGAGEIALEETFGMDAAEMAALEYSVATDDIEAQTIEVSKTSDTNGVDIFAFEIEETEGIDVNIGEMTMTFATTGNEASVLKKAYLVQDGTVVGTESMVNGGALTFDNLDIDIEGDSTSEFVVRVDIEDTNDGARYAEGSTVEVTVNDITELTDAMGNDEDDIADLAIDLDSEQHVLRSEGIKVEVTEAKTTVTAVDDANNDIVEFTWTVDITAFGNKDVYINSDPAQIVSTLAGATDAEILYAVVKSGGADLTSLGATISESDTDVTEVTGAGGYTGTPYSTETFFKIAKGKTGTFTINLSGTNQTNSKQVRAYLSNIEWTIDQVANGAATGAASGVNAYTFQLEDDSKTPFKTVN